MRGHVVGRPGPVVAVPAGHVDPERQQGGRSHRGVGGRERTGGDAVARSRRGPQRRSVGGAVRSRPGAPRSAPRARSSRSGRVGVGERVVADEVLDQAAELLDRVGRRRGRLADQREDAFVAGQRRSGRAAPPWTGGARRAPPGSCPPPSRCRGWWCRGSPWPRRRRPPRRAGGSVRRARRLACCRHGHPSVDLSHSVEP